MSDQTPQTITLYMRPGCHLCEDAADLLERLRLRFPLQVVEVNILSDLGLYERYKQSIPVLAFANGTTLCAPIREADVLRVLG